MSEVRRELTRFQREYFENRDKATMRRAPGPYVLRHVEEMERALALKPGEGILEVGCGQGRYLIPLLERGLDVEGFDLSPVLLERLRKSAGDLGPSLKLVSGDLVEPCLEREGAYDAVIGFFVLHHLHDVPACLRNLARWVKPGGRVGFLEPNPMNPLFHVQILLTPGMSYRGERSIMKMKAKVVLETLAESGMVGTRLERLGFFPPFLANRTPMKSIERALEAFPPWRGLLPFQLFLAERPK